MTDYAGRDTGRLQCRHLSLDLGAGPHVMGILNVTPDSFSDGGRYMCADAALQRAQAMAEEGARIIDVGGASSRPQGTVYGRGASVVPPEQEAVRVVPVIRQIAKVLPQMILSVDTYQPSVARAALEAGAHMVNDITGLRYNPEMAEVVAAFGAALVLMHSVGRPGAMPHEHSYSNNLMVEIRISLEKAVHIAETAGVHHLVLDPGFGFGKTAKQNLQLIHRLNELCVLGRPVMVGISRKSTIGHILGAGDAVVPVERRLYGTLGTTAVAVMRGARLVRTHDVKPTADLVNMIHATTKGL